MSKAKRGRGRPATDEPRSNLTIRVTESERAAIEAAAIRESAKRGELLTVSSWLRRVALAAAKA